MGWYGMGSFGWLGLIGVLGSFGWLILLNRHGLQAQQLALVSVQGKRR
jgi:hypothetical protein